MDAGLVVPAGHFKPAHIMSREQVIAHTKITTPWWDAAHRIGQLHVTWWYHREMDRARFIRAPAYPPTLNIEYLRPWLVGCMVDTQRNQVWEPVRTALDGMGSVGVYTFWCIASAWLRSARDKYRNMERAMNVGLGDLHESR